MDSEIRYSESIENLKINDSIKNHHYTVLVCEKGTISIKIGYHHFELAPNTIAILPPDVLFSTNNASENLEVKQIFFTKLSLQKMFLKENIVEELLTLNSKYPPVYDLMDRVSSVSQTFKKIQHELEFKHAYYLDIIRLNITEILYEYNRACEFCLLGFDKNMNRNYQLTHEFKKLVEEHYVTWNSIGTYASHLGISAKHLTEVVKEETGSTALQIIHEKLLLESQYLLKHTTISIKQCADKLGFETASYFSRFFKTHTNRSPNDFRKNP